MAVLFVDLAVENLENWGKFKPIPKEISHVYSNFNFFLARHNLDRIKFVA